jgi:hypothetical protein
MDEDLISAIDVALQLRKRKQTIFKILKRLGIETQKRRSGKRGQIVAYITQDEFRLLSHELPSPGDEGGPERNQGNPATEATYAEQGVFYLVQLEPDHDPMRIKVGFALRISERLRALRCSAPFTNVIKTWPCKMLWEKTAIESVTDGCERLHTEVFRTDSIDTVIGKCDKFFGLMPKLSGENVDS